MQTTSTLTEQATRIFNHPHVNEPLLRHTTDVVLDTLTKSYMALVAFDCKPFHDTPEVESDLAKVARWLTTAGMKRGLIISGQTSTGKTTLARAMWMTLRYHGAPAQGVDARKVGEIYKNSERERYYQLTHAARLFIDDLGAEYSSVKVYGEEASPLVALIMEYHKYNKPLIITTNLDEQGIQDTYGVRIADRLSQLCNFMQVTNNQNFRKL